MSINHLVYGIISPVLEHFINATERVNVQLRSEKEILSTDGETGGKGEHVVVDLTELRRDEYILIVEAMQNSLGQALEQCLLAMKDMHGNNGGQGTIYGFVTTGRGWRMVTYDGKLFQRSEELLVLFGTMRSDKQRWMDDYSVVVDCIYAALSKGGDKVVR